MAGLSIPVIYEDQSLLVINKPAGTHSVMLPSEISQPLAGQNSVAAFLINRSPEMRVVALRPEDGGLVHRLDHDTSGILVAAKTREVWQILRDAIQAGQVHKEYLAIVVGKFVKAQEVSGFIGSSSRSAKKVRVFSDPPRAKFRVLPATSYFEPLGYNSEQNLSLVKVLAPTARLHQVRAFAAFIGHPLWNDGVYGCADLSAGMAGFVLHANKVRLALPKDGAPLTFEAPSPTIISTLFQKSA